MAKSQENNTITLLGLKNCKAEEVVSGDDGVTVKIIINGGREKCPYCGSTKLYRHGMCAPRHVLHTWTNGTKIYLDLHRGNVGGAAIAAILLSKARNWYALVPGLPGRLKPEPYGSSRIETSAR